ncbi:MAG TPA: iron-sulfur cluster assembly accessory protein [Planctomycetota bacterium]|nr:iron-sulfur cluster assembly accessory protein [Planctomycetota bacterium]
MLTISDKAAEKIRTLLEQEKKSPETWGLRLGIEGGGCSGLQYKLDLTESRPGDNVVEHRGARVYVDAKSLQYVDNSVVDFMDALTGAGFKIINPQEKNSCGCGTSFSV